MCFSSPPKVPSPPPTEQKADAAVQAKTEEERRRQRTVAGYASTFLTGGAGLTAPANTAPKTLLGA